MERVQFQQEQMLAELKDLLQKGLFSQKEVRQIMQKRTAFETALVRRVAKKGDFLRYAAYEMGLEALRRKRVQRLKSGSSAPSVSDYALVRRQFQIFERALKKFKDDVGLWIQYIQVAKREGARALVGRITARALQLHPNTPGLYIIAAQHELAHLSPGAARVILQRGLRLNSESVEMWREYVKMELAFVEGLRRRWSVLGIDTGASSSKAKAEGKTGEKASEKGKERAVDEEIVAFDLIEDADAEDAEGEAEKMDVDAEGEGEDFPEDEAARREILNGAIVKSVMLSAVKALPKIELFTSLHGLLATYPLPTTLRTTLLDHLFALLSSTLPHHPEAVKLSATRDLVPGLKSEGLVDAIRSANEELVAAVNETAGESKHDIEKIYCDFVTEWCDADIDDTLKCYVLTGLYALSSKSSSPALLSTTLRLLTSHPSLHAALPPPISTPVALHKLARKYTQRAKNSSEVWLARLDLEAAFPSEQSEESVWAEARAAVLAGEGVRDVWLWGIARKRARPTNSTGISHTAELHLLETLLGESKRIADPAAFRVVHEELLVRYAAVRLADVAPRRADVSGTGTPPAGAPDARIRVVRELGTAYLPSGAVWAHVFALVCPAAGAGAQEDLRVLGEVYELWRRQDGVRATGAYAEALLRAGRGREAQNVVSRAGTWLGRDETEEIERRWVALLDGENEEPARDDEDDG